MIDSIRYDYYLHAGSYHGRCPMPPPYVARPQPNVHQQFPMICQSIETNNGYIRKIAPTNYLQQQNGEYNSNLVYNILLLLNYFLLNISMETINI